MPTICYSLIQTRCWSCRPALPGLTLQALGDIGRYRAVQATDLTVCLVLPTTNATPWWLAAPHTCAASSLPEQPEQGRAAMQTLLAQALYPPSEASRMLGNKVFYGI